MKNWWKNSFYQGGVLLLLSSIFINILNYFFYLVIGKYLGPTTYGEIVALLSYSTIISVPTAILSTIIIQKVSSSKNAFAKAQMLELFFWSKVKKNGGF